LSGAGRGVYPVLQAQSQTIQAPPKPQVSEQPRSKRWNLSSGHKTGLSEEEIFLAKSLEQINREKPLQMIHFDYDKFFVRDDAKTGLEANAVWLKKFGTAKILIEGHCDERGTEDYNLALARRGPRPPSIISFLWGSPRIA